jgi:tRNA 2-thiouridine synthesizing protein A
VLRVFATDPGSVKDFSAFAVQTGNQLLGSKQNDAAVFEFLLKRR